MKKEIHRVLIHRLGSLGDTVVALPSIRLIAEQFPYAERRMLTARPIDRKAAPIVTILDKTGLVDGYFHYSVGMRNPMELWKLRSEIRNWNADLLIYLVQTRSLLQTLRDWVFFRSCGMRWMVGFPFRKPQRQPQRRPNGDLYVHEAQRLADRIKELGRIDLGDQRVWDLQLTGRENFAGQEAIDQLVPRTLIACSVGTKMDAKYWGERNWESLLEELAVRYPNYGLVLVGSSEERELSENVSKAWKGRSVNLCGKLSPRESAATLKNVAVFIGHDSGPMHLAACVGVSCVAIFSARSLPGVWFPYGVGHEVIYHQTECFGCELEVCIKQAKKCIMSISVSEVVRRVDTVLEIRALSVKSQGAL